MVRIIAITGGIGSGKSVINRILSTKGYMVYDCDSAAKIIMDNDTNIKEKIKRHIHHKAVSNGVIDRKLLAQIVFSDKKKLDILNSLVHNAVINDMLTQAHKNNLIDSLFFVETAILYQSGMDKVVDEVWEITAPESIRIQRVIKRNNCTVEEVKSRIVSQDSYIPTTHHHSTFIILNDGTHPVLPQIENRLESLSS